MATPTARLSLIFLWQHVLLLFWFNLNISLIVWLERTCCHKSLVSKSADRISRHCNCNTENVLQLMLIWKKSHLKSKYQIYVGRLGNNIGIIPFSPPSAICTNPLNYRAFSMFLPLCNRWRKSRIYLECFILQ